MTGLEEVRALLGYPVVRVLRVVHPQSGAASWRLTRPPAACGRCGRVHHVAETVEFVGADVRNPKRLRGRLVALGWMPSRPVDAEFGHDLVRALWRCLTEEGTA